MVEQKYCVYDYNEMCPIVYEKEEPKEPLTSDFFNPYTPLDPEYKLAIGDILEISIFGDEDSYVDDAVVAPDGKVYYSVLEEGVPAANHTMTELSEQMETKLKNLYINPIVIVTSKERISQSFRILGRVRLPGVYPLPGPLTLKEAVGASGGLFSQSDRDWEDERNLTVPFEDLGRSFIARDGRKLDVDFRKLLESSDNSQNIYLRPGDYIYIAPFEKSDVYVLGSVIAPQRVAFTPGMTLMQALAYAGGWPFPGPYSADLQRVLLIRGELNCPCVMQVNIWDILNGDARDIYLQSGDILYAQNKKFRLGRDLVYIAVEAFVHAFVTSAGGHYARTHWFH